LQHNPFKSGNEWSASHGSPAELMIFDLFYHQFVQGVGIIGSLRQSNSGLANTGYISAPVGYLNISRGRIHGFTE
jgi:hypothetical protein